MMKKSHHQEIGPKAVRATAWDDAEIVIDIQHTESDTALDDHLRKEQTRAVLDLLADHKRKLDKNGDAQP